MIVSTFLQHFSSTGDSSAQPFTKASERSHAVHRSLRLAVGMMFVACLGAVFPDGAGAQVIQFPSQHVFHSQGSVLVPDRGTAFLGGVGRGYNSAVHRGGFPYGHRGFASGYGFSQLSVTATVIDLNILDHAIRSGLAAPGLTSDTRFNGGSRIGPYAGPAPTANSLPSRDPGPPAGAWQQMLSSGAGSISPDPARQTSGNAEYYLEMAKQAKDRNRFASARVYYQMALEALPPSALNQVAEQLDKPEPQADQTADNTKAGTPANKPGRVAF